MYNIFIMKTIDLIITILTVSTSVINYLYIYKNIYYVVGIFATRKFPPAAEQHKYAVLVAARNEAPVIGNLLESIRMQDYPSELVTVFVVADNCTDDTARIAREGGAVCYERSDPDRRTKGFALQFLVEQIRRDYGIDAFEGYFLFDADNLLKSDYISRMNDSFDAGEKIITSYRNTKNFDDNWISASYAIHWLRTIRSEHRARSLFRLATRIQGTGFLFAWEIIKDGWNYTSLTEDRALSADAVVNGYRISYNNAAEFYDEQPVDLKIALRQRIRWAKGHLQAFVESGGKLFKNIFTTRKIGFAGRFMSLDMLNVIFPRSLMTMSRKFIVFVLEIVLLIIAHNKFGAYVTLILSLLIAFAQTFGAAVLSAAYVLIIEHKRIKKIKWYKAVWFCIMFPFFDIIGKISTWIALFSKVEWKPIPHNSSININDIGRR